MPDEPRASSERELREEVERTMREAEGVKQRQQEKRERAEERVKETEEQYKEEKKAGGKATRQAAGAAIVGAEPVAAEKGMEALAHRSRAKGLKRQLSRLKGKVKELGAGGEKSAGRTYTQAAFIGLIGLVLFFLLSRTPYGQFGIYALLFAVVGVIWQFAPMAAFVLLVGCSSYAALDFFGFLTQVNIAVTMIMTVLGIMYSFEASRETVAKIFKWVLVGFGGIIVFFLSAWAIWQLGLQESPMVANMALMTIIITYFMFIWSAMGFKKTFAFTLLNIVVLFALFAYPEGLLGINSPFYPAAKGQQEAWGEMWASFGVFGEQIERGIERQRAYMLGDYEQGIEESQDKPLGVFLDDVGVTSRVVLEGEEVNMFADLRAEAFKMEEGLNISLSCHPKNREEVLGDIRPSETITVFEYERQPIDCIMHTHDLGGAGGGMFEPPSGGAGEHTIVLNALFDFKTAAYKRAYFMEQERLRAIKRAGQDPLETVPEKRPVAHFTPGPVAIGMKTDEMPIPLVPGYEYGPSLSISLENNWQGKLENVTELMVTVPAGLEMTEMNGKDLAESSGANCMTLDTGEHQCIIEGELVRTLFPPTRLREAIVITRVQTRLKENGVQELLRGQPLGFGSYKAEVKYKYLITRQASVLVKEDVPVQQ